MHRRSFTLFELILVMVILGLIVGFVFPDLASMLRARSLTESADRLRALLVMTHARAMNDGVRYRIEFPGTPDPLDEFADEKIDIPTETLQPIVKRQVDVLGNPDAFGDVGDDWAHKDFVQEGTRCIAVLPDRPNFDETSGSPIAGMQIDNEQAEFVPLTINPDGTCDHWVTFVLTDLPFETELKPGHASRIMNVVVDGRTGKAWLQRALTVEEVELLNELGASPVFHQDFTSPKSLTEEAVVRLEERNRHFVGKKARAE